MDFEKMNTDELEQHLESEGYSIDEWECLADRCETIDKKNAVLKRCLKMNLFSKESIELYLRNPNGSSPALQVGVLQFESEKIFYELSETLKESTRKSCIMLNNGGKYFAGIHDFEKATDLYKSAFEQAPDLDLKCNVIKNQMDLLKDLPENKRMNLAQEIINEIDTHSFAEWQETGLLPDALIDGKLTWKTIKLKWLQYKSQNTLNEPEFVDPNIDAWESLFNTMELISWKQSFHMFSPSMVPPSMVLPPMVPPRSDNTPIPKPAVPLASIYSVNQHIVPPPIVNHMFPPVPPFNPNNQVREPIGIQAIAHNVGQRNIVPEQQVHANNAENPQNNAQMQHQ